MHKKAMVVGGGVAGIQAALDLADMGIETFLIERGPSIGGRMAQLDKTFPTNDCAMCILSPKLVQAGSHPYIHIITLAEVAGIEGTSPNLKVSVRITPRYIDESKCTGCGICVARCPVKVPDPYNKGLSTTKALKYVNVQPAVWCSFRPSRFRTIGRLFARRHFQRKCGFSGSNNFRSSLINIP